MFYPSHETGKNIQLVSNWEKKPVEIDRGIGMYILLAQRSVSGKGSALGHHQFTALSSCSMYLKQEFLMGFVSRIISDGGAAAAPTPLKKALRFKHT